MLRSLPKPSMLLAGAVLASAVSGAACAQTSSNSSVSGSIAIFQPVTLTKGSDLSFGTVMRPASGSGDVIINATTGARSVTGNVQAMANGPAPAPSRATFTVSGEGGLNYSISYPGNFSLMRNGNQDPIQVNLNATSGGGALSGSAGSTGTATFGIGGQLTISSSTPTGSYTGSFTVTVSYN